MNIEGAGVKKRLSVDQLKPGMYIVELDHSWLQTPFLFHSKRIKDASDIELLVKAGIREVVIDTQLSVELQSSPAEHVDESEVGPSDSTLPELQSDPQQSAYDSILHPLIQEIGMARAIQEEALATVQLVFDGVGRGSPLNSPAAKQTITKLLGSVTRSPEANLLLTQMRRFQTDLFTHSMNVCVLSLVVAISQGFTTELDDLGLGALLHDIGQVRLPRNLIRKASAFTEQEWRLVEQHPVLGAAILEQAENIPVAARDVVRQHHERMNGGGYPLRISGQAISPLSQIVAITDAYDAMITGRNGVLQRPIEILRQLYLDANAGVFDRDLIEKVIRSLGVYPVGSLVELNTGERGIVLATNRADALRPTLRLILSRDGFDLPKGPVISLADEASLSSGRQIVRTLDPGKERIDVVSYIHQATGLTGKTAWSQ